MLGFDSELYGAAFADTEVADLFSDGAELRAMIRVERALARVQGGLGLIPAAAAGAIDRTLGELTPAPAALAAACRKDGVVVPALVKQLRAALPEHAASHLHWGATSQDIVDTALVLRLGSACDRLEQLLATLGDALADLAEREMDTVMVARTRAQWAVPTLGGLKVANWLAPLARQRQRLQQLRPRLLVLQFGGAAGTLAALGDRGPAVSAALAAELGLALPPAPWHTQRDSLIEQGNWLAMTCGALGKMGQDLILLTQSDVGEIKLRGSGGSSTMPQKANPVSPEHLVALARHSAGLLANLHSATIHANERDGAAWTLEWLNLPQLVCATSGALTRAAETVAALTFDRARIQANLETCRDDIMAEALVFALAEHSDRNSAQQLVARARELAGQKGLPLVEQLRSLTELPLDWEHLAQPQCYLGAARHFIRATLDYWRTMA
ncbi:3-carboxy-cis,cis-muconate cycloisomerase [Microbulbifer taiwanensis]|uniref:3-carboxy-cis,cis-muconate cycloisomerase n=1 Tax=Microbulbifer taiwanensis TaxID=986746 RepID=A0ABW1YKY7_9GAMM|nr:3-carboxy-cis,cis-muconate cycloisomerase [Microbulbifer taiwanensis]